MGFFDSFFGGAADGAGKGGGDSIWSNPTFLSSALIAGTQLVSGLFGSSAEEEALASKNSETARQFDAELAFKEKELAQRMAIAQLQAGGGGGGGGGASAAAAAALKQGKSAAIGNAAANKSAALQIPLAAMKDQTEAAQLTGKASGDFFNTLVGNMQRPALSRAQ